MVGNMKMYRIERKLIKRPVPEYALSAVAYYYKSFPIKSLSEQQAKYEMDSIEQYLKGFIYKRRNSLVTLGVSHRIDHIDNRITVYTINDKPVMTFWIEEEP